MSTWYMVCCEYDESGRSFETGPVMKHRYYMVELVV